MIVKKDLLMVIKSWNSFWQICFNHELWKCRVMDKIRTTEKVSILKVKKSL